MKKYIKAFATIYIMFLCISYSSAQVYQSSVGIRLGTSLSGSYKLYITERKAIEAIVGISRVGGNSLLSCGGTYQVHNQITSNLPSLSWYLGAGGVYRFGNENIERDILLTTIIGLEYTFENAPFNLFIDISPYATVVTGIDYDVEASLGARYIF